MKRKCYSTFFLFIISRKFSIHSFHFFIYQESNKYIHNTKKLFKLRKNYIFLFDISIYIISQSYTPDILFLSIENVAMWYKAFRLSIELRTIKKISPTFRTITAHFAPWKDRIRNRRVYLPTLNKPSIPAFNFTVAGLLHRQR